MFPWVIFFAVFCVGPLVVGALGNCPVCLPLNSVPDAILRYDHSQKSQSQDGGLPKLLLA